MIVNHADHTTDNPNARDAGWKRAALYLRSACAPQGDPGSALDAQRRFLLDFAARYDLEPVAEYRDIGVSGLDARRPGLNSLLDAARRDCRPFDIVLVKSPSRLSRHSNGAAEIARQLMKQRVLLYLADRGEVAGLENLFGRDA